MVHQDVRSEGPVSYTHIDVYKRQGLDASALTGYSLNAFASGCDGSGLTSGYVSALETIWDAAEFKKQGSAKITVLSLIHI